MIRKFHLQRIEDESGVSGTGRVAEGVVFSNGWVAMTWLTRHTSAAVYTSLHEVEKIHGHSGKTKIVMDEDDYTYEPLGYRSLFELGRANNGWTLREYESGTLLVESETSEETEHRAFANLIWSLLSNHGPSDSKYSPERILVNIVPGSDCENAHLSLEQVKDKSSDHLDYALRFLRNVNPSEKPENFDEIISSIEDAYKKILNYNMS
jgi:hypothetical protein